MLLDIIPDSEVKLDSEFINPDVLRALIQEDEILYLKGAMQLFGIPVILADQDHSIPETEANVKRLEIEKRNLEKGLERVPDRLRYLKDLLSKVEKDGGRSE